MDEQSFVASLSQPQLELMNQIRQWIDAYHPGLKTQVAPMMGLPMFMFCADGDYRFGFTKGKHLTFHNMDIYCNPDLHAEYTPKLGVPKSRIKKSCINLDPKDKLDLNVFEAMIKASAR